jgi:FkbM family methyltransferase
MSPNRTRTLYQKSMIFRALVSPFVLPRRWVLTKRKLQKKKILRDMTALFVDDPVIRVNEFDGIFSMDRRGDIFSRIILKGRYEPHIASVCKQYLDENRDAIDVGANIGFFTVYLAKHTNDKKVLSIEPVKNALQRLHKNIALNNVENKVIVFEGVASASRGEAIINTISGMEEYSSIGQLAHPAATGKTRTTEKVKSTTIDDLVNQHSLDPGFIKIDVEGMEHHVISGSEMVLRHCRPIILSELSNVLLAVNGSSAKSVIQSIQAYGYEVIDPIDPLTEPGGKDFGDILCIPKELV